MEFVKDMKNKKIFVKREFNAPVREVWKAWTDSELLDLWWAPKPWKAKTKKMDFRVGGSWLYAMVGPKGEEHFSRSDFEEIIPVKSFTAADYFCDKNGNKNSEMGTGRWKCIFEESHDKTIVNIEITFEKEADLQKMIEMGFKEGFTAGLNNLDELLERKSIKTT